MPKIFICYRREDTPGYAGRLYDRLQNEFGRDHVFIDVDTLQPGDDFVEAIGERLRGLDVMLAVIGPRWLAAVDQRGVPRLQDEGDYVRLELQTALERGIATIPVLVERATMPRSQDLPPPIRSLVRRQAIELSDTRWTYDVATLMERIKRLPSAGAATNQAKPSAFFTKRGKEKRRPQPDVRDPFSVATSESAKDLPAGRGKRRLRSVLLAMFLIPIGIAAGAGLASWVEAIRQRQIFLNLCDQWDVDGCIAVCERGDPPDPRSCTILGLMYRNGDHGLARDHRRALDLFGYACDERYANACTQLGWMYEKGLGVREDPGAARQLYRRACQDGDDFGCDYFEK